VFSWLGLNSQTVLNVQKKKQSSTKLNTTVEMNGHTIDRAIAIGLIGPTKLVLQPTSIRNYLKTKDNTKKV